MGHSSKEMGQAWERQPKESAPAYEAFCLYRDLPYGDEPEKRSLLKVSKKLTKSETIIKRWSSDWDWLERCREYDNELQRIEFEEHKAAIKAMQEKHLEVAAALLEKAMSALEQLPEEDLDPKNLLNIITHSIDIERRARIEQLGAPLSTGGSGKNAVTITDVDEPEQSTMMQLVKSLETARREKESRE